MPATPEGIGTLAESLLPSDRVALEVTGSSREIVRLLEPHVSKVIVVSPRDTGISQARAKTDRLSSPSRDDEDLSRSLPARGACHCFFDLADVVGGVDRRVQDLPRDESGELVDQDTALVLGVRRNQFTSRNPRSVRSRKTKASGCTAHGSPLMRP